MSVENSLTKRCHSPALPTPALLPMGKLLLPVIFILFLALNIAAYAFITFELDGSTIKTKQKVTEQEMRVR